MGDDFLGHGIVGQWQAVAHTTVLAWRLLGEHIRVANFAVVHQQHTASFVFGIQVWEVVAARGHVQLLLSQGHGAWLQVLRQVVVTQAVARRCLSQLGRVIFHEADPARCVVVLQLLKVEQVARRWAAQFAATEHVEHVQFAVGSQINDVARRQFQRVGHVISELTIGQGGQALIDLFHGHRRLGFQAAVQLQTAIEQGVALYVVATQIVGQFDVDKAAITATLIVAQVRHQQAHALGAVEA